MRIVRRSLRGWPVLGFCAVSIWPLTAKAEENAARPSEPAVAARVDQLLQRAAKAPLPPRTDDVAFLRRVSLDLTGRLPKADEIEQFTHDSDSEKRAQRVERLLASDAYAVNWGRYWRDVLTYHTPASGNYLRWELFDRWLKDQIKQNRPWGDVVTALVTAVGVNDECPPGNYMSAH